MRGFSPQLCPQYFSLYEELEQETIRNVEYPLFLSVFSETNSEEAFSISWRTSEYRSGFWSSSRNSKSGRYQNIWEWNG